MATVSYNTRDWNVVQTGNGGVSATYQPSRQQVTSNPTNTPQQTYQKSMSSILTEAKKTNPNYVGVARYENGVRTFFEPNPLHKTTPDEVIPGYDSVRSANNSAFSKSYSSTASKSLSSTPRTGGNAQGVRDSVATPANFNENTSLNISGTSSGGILSRLTSATAATPNSPTMETLTESKTTGGRAAGGMTAQASQPAPNQGLVQSYFDKLTGNTPQETAQTEQYRQMFEAARRGASRNPADEYNAQRENALKTAIGQAVRQNGAGQGQGTVTPDGAGVATPTIRQNADGTRSTIGTVNGEEVDYGDASPADAAKMQATLAGVQGLMDDFYKNDLDFMTNV